MKSLLILTFRNNHLQTFMNPSTNCKADKTNFVNVCSTVGDKKERDTSNNTFLNSWIRKKAP